MEGVVSALVPLNDGTKEGIPVTQTPASSPATPETDRVRRIMDRMAPSYDKQMGRFEKLLFPGAREWVCSRAHGDVLEIAIGTGLNLGYYPAGVRLTGVELSPVMLQQTRARAEQMGMDVELHLGDVQALEFPDASFDTVVCTFALCTIPDDRQAVREAFRVLRPGGQFVLAEHVRSTKAWVRAGQHVWDFFSVRLEGDHVMREPLDHVRAEGFAVQEQRRLKLGLVEHIAAHKPGSSRGDR
jgi:ubiquinone/menaquinone biosynthesis C-methylase UbiE